MDITAVLELLYHGNQLKRTVRTGWTQRGVVDAEDVAAHSYGVVFAALVLAQVIDEPLDLGKLLAIATLHDLPEGLTTDIPTPVMRFLPSGAKTEMERGAMGEILAGISFAPSLMELWEALHAGDTIESRIVHDADKLDMYLQAIAYEEQTGNQRLAEFWATRHVFYFPEAQAIYDELRHRWDTMRGDGE